VPEVAWAGKKNGELLTLAAEKFDAFVAVDQGLSHQQNLSKFEIAVIVLLRPSNRLSDLLKLLPELLDALNASVPGHCVVVSSKLEA